MQIVGGVHKGVKLAAPKGQATRPTSARTREAVFNILAHGIEGFAFAGTRVLDLFAGTGALGLEAISRGSSFCLFVDDQADARALIRQNVETLGLTGHTKIFRRDATDLGPIQSLKRFDLVFADPPYDKGLGEKALVSLREGGWLVPGAILVLEERHGVEVQLPDGFALLDQRRHGEAQTLIVKSD